MPKRRVLPYSLDPNQPGDEFLFNLLIAPVAIVVNLVASLPGAAPRLAAGKLHSRVPATILIAIGAFIPTITDSLNRAGSTELFQLGKFLGVVFLFAGFLVSIEVFREIRIPFTSVRLATGAPGRAWPRATRDRARRRRAAALTTRAPATRAPARPSRTGRRAGPGPSRDCRRRLCSRHGRLHSGVHGGRGAAPRIRVLLVDDHEVVRRGMRGFFELLDDIEVVGEAEDGRQAVDSVGRSTRTSC